MLRFVRRQAIRSPSLHRYARHFHLSTKDGARLLREYVRGAEVTAAADEQDLSSSSGAQSDKTINILLHADRRAKSLPPTGAKAEFITHFGPALLGCHDAHLRSAFQSRKTFAHGDLGILHLQEVMPSRVVDLPIRQSAGLPLDKSFGFLLRMAPIANMSVPEPIQWQAAEVLREVYSVFHSLEGVWFSFRLSFANNAIQIQSPFLEFDEHGIKRTPNELLQSMYNDSTTPA